MSAEAEMDGRTVRTLSADGRLVGLSGARCGLDAAEALAAALVEISGCDESVLSTETDLGKDLGFDQAKIAELQKVLFDRHDITIKDEIAAYSRTFGQWAGICTVDFIRNAPKPNFGSSE